MAEAALFSLASKLLSTIASPAFDKAYERAQSIWGARNELEELRDTIKTIQVVLLDSEKKHKDSAAVKHWIKRVRDVLYDADDLFDEVATDDMLMQQMKGDKYVKEVRAFFSKLNPIASNDSIAKKVKAIRQGLCKICDEMALLNFVKCDHEKPMSGMRRGVETGSFIGPNEVIGRDDEKKEVLSFLYDKAYAERNISLISIVGIGGMGKSTLAQLVYNDQKIQNDFQKTYWACISDVFDEKEVIGKMYQSITNQGEYQGLSLDQLQSSIRESIDRDGKFLIVLDDLWDQDPARGRKLWSILSSGDAKGSKIIVTTRQSAVAKAMKADKTLELKGLSTDASWDLFRRFAFTQEQENDPAWISLGEKIVNKCANVPLAIKSIASLLSIKDTMAEWRSFENEELSKIQVSDDAIMSTLRLSYDHLPSHLKDCFAYCSLFPKDSELDKHNLINLWIAQGYVKPKTDETLEMAGHAYFMELFRRSFFQEATMDREGIEIESCKMHDLVHDLALDVAGEESIMLIKGMNQYHKKVRHLSVACRISWSIPLSSLNADRLRSCLFMFKDSCSSRVVDQQVTKFRFLRALNLAGQNLFEVPCSIGELKCLRYLNLSSNRFKHLPDSITKLVNLVTIDISWCGSLLELPGEFRGLISLRHLINQGYGQIPLGFGEMTSLQHLSEFRVRKSGGVDGKCFVGLDALARLNLQGKLEITYDKDDEWYRDDVTLECGQIPDTLETLSIEHYPSVRIPTWWREDPASRLPKLECLHLQECEHVKHLAPLRSLPCLRFLHVEQLVELEYMEEDGVVSTAPFFPCLQTLWINSLPKLKGWSTRLNATANEEQPLFPRLSQLCIDNCPCLVSIPLAQLLRSLSLRSTSEELVIQVVSTCIASSPSTSTPSSSLQEFSLSGYENLRSFLGEDFTALRKLRISHCPNLRYVRVAPNVLEEFAIYGCRSVELWEHKEEEESSVDWASFSNLRSLAADEIPEVERLPENLQQLISLGKLQMEQPKRWWS